MARLIDADALEELKGDTTGIVCETIEDYKCFEEIKKFSEAQEEAEKRGENEFACPLCGGEAFWARSGYNNHLRCGCKKCGFRMTE